MRNLLPNPLNYARQAVVFLFLATMGSAMFGQTLEPIFQSDPNNPFVEASPNMIPSVNYNASPEALWDIQGYFDATAAASGDLGMAACLFFNNEFWVSRWASDTLYRFSSAGVLVSEFVITGITGTRALTTDGTNLYAGTANANIYVINPVTQSLISTITTNVTTGIRHITYDPTLNSNAGGFWVGNFNTDILPVSMTGTTLPGGISANTHGLGGMYGSAWDGTSAGGPYLWIFHQGGASNCEITQLQLPNGTQTLVTNDVMSDVGLTAGLSSGLAGGLCISNSYSPGNRSLIGCIQGTPNNVVFAYELSDPVLPATDLEVDGLRPTNGYTQIPAGQVFGETFDVTLANVGTDPVDTAFVDFSVSYNGGAPVWTNTQMTMNLASSGTVLISSGAFTPANGVGTYDLTAIARIGSNQNDTINNNDTLVFSFQVTDSTFARDNGVPNGTPYSVSSSDWAYAMSTYTLANPDTVTSIWISLETPIANDSTYAIVANTVGGSPNAPLAFGDVNIISSGQNDYVLLIPGGYPLAAGTYAFGCYEGAGTTINLRQSPNVYTPGTNFFLTGANGWSPSNIQTSRFIRPNFGSPTMVSVDQMRDNSVQVFPNPSNGNFTVMFREELNSELNVRVVNMVGQEVANAVVNPSATRTHTFDLSNQAAGVYFVRVEGSEGTVVKKIMVTR